MLEVKSTGWSSPSFRTRPVFTPSAFEPGGQEVLTLTGVAPCRQTRPVDAIMSETSASDGRRKNG